MARPPRPGNETRFIGKATWPVRRLILFCNAFRLSGLTLNLRCAGGWLAGFCAGMFMLPQTTISRVSNTEVFFILYCYSVRKLFTLLLMPVFHSPVYGRTY